MKPTISSYWLLLLGPLTLTACPAGGVGDPCIPEDEYHQDFSGYGFKEVNVESRSFQCETRVCLVNHFQGRVSCPYGQDQAAADSFETAADWGNNCRIPGTNGSVPTDRVNVPVVNQLEERRTSQAVYCSCRCANADGKTDDGARYCDCPTGYQCERLIDNVGLGNAQLAGAYCIKKGTKFDQVTAEASPKCDLLVKNCGEAIPF